MGRGTKLVHVRLLVSTASAAFLPRQGLATLDALRFLSRVQLAVPARSRRPVAQLPVHRKQGLVVSKAISRKRKESKLKFEPAPILLGFVLGRHFEESFRRALLLSRGDLLVFVERPLSAFFLSLCVLLVGSQIYLYLRRQRAHLAMA